MGMGKTAATLSALDLLWLAGSGYWPALVIAPLRVARGTWPREAQKWAEFNGLRVTAITGDANTRAFALRSKADVYTINFENLVWLFDTLGPDNWPFKIVVIDEATRLKGFRLKKGTKRSTLLSEIAARTGRWIELTGTPAPNGLKDLWGQLWFIDQGKRLGYSHSDFMGRFFNTNQYSGEVTPEHFALDQIPELVRDVCLTVRAKDYFDIKDPIKRVVEIDLPQKARALYRELEKEMYAEIDKLGAHIDVVNAAGLSAKCLQLASGAVIARDAEDDKMIHHVHDEKLDALESIIEEANGAPVLVGYWWKHDLARMMKRFPFMQQIKTQKDEDRWNEGRIVAAPAHYASLGHGLNLQDGGHRLVRYSRWWDAELDDQLAERIGPVRQIQSGYDRPVWHYDIVARDTIDMDVAYRHETKAEVQNILRDRTRRRA
jgi:SNF2 family DNA or RNA helicase